IGWVLEVRHHASRSADQDGADVWIATLADAAHLHLAPCARVFGHEAQAAGELTSIAPSSAILAKQACQRGCSEQAQPRNSSKPLGGLRLLLHQRQFGLHR